MRLQEQNGCAATFYIIHGPHSCSLWVLFLSMTCEGGVCAGVPVWEYVVFSLKCVDLLPSPDDESLDPTEEHC